MIDRQSGRVVKAMMPVHIFGLPCQMDEVMEIAREYGLQVIEDACEAIGAEFDGQRDRDIRKCRSVRLLSQQANDHRRRRHDYDQRSSHRGIVPQHEESGARHGWRLAAPRSLGYNYRLSELHAALGLAQLERIESILASRAEVARRYSELLSGQSRLQLLENDARTKRSWFVYIIRFRSDSSAALRESVRSALREKGIATQIYFTPIHQQPFYQKCQPGPEPSLPHTDQAANECLAIPFHTRLSEMEIKYVCDSIRQALETEKQEPSTNRERVRLVSTHVTVET